MPSNRPVYSCVRCSDRKVKCDRDYPCGACKKHNVECTYRPARHSRKRLKLLERDALIDRVQQYEAFIKKQGFHPEAVSRPGTVLSGDTEETQSPQTDRGSQQPEPSLAPSEAREHFSRGQNCSDRGRMHFVDNSLMTRIAKELPEAKKDAHDSSDELSDGEHSENNSDLLMGERFGQSRRNLLSHYVASTKVALARADFMNSKSLVVLQALTLHILSVRDTSSPRSIWTLTGVALRIAEAIGLRQNATLLALAPFEAEIWRRTWSCLKMHDNRAAEMCGLPTFQPLNGDIHMTGTLTNTDDADIYPGMPAPPSDSSKPTDMVFCAVQSEFFAFAGRMAAINRKACGPNFVADIFATKESVMPNDDAIQELENHIETKYLRYCEPSDPLHLTTVLFARYSLNVCRFMARHPRKWKSRLQVPESERKYVWNVSLKLLEQFDMIQSSPHIRQFSWNFAYYLKWSAFVHVLDTLRVEPLVVDSSKAWRLVETTFQNNPAMMTDTERTLYVAVGNLCLKAFKAREIAMAREGIVSGDVPPFMHQLRQIQETARLRLQTKLSLRRQGKDSRFKISGTETPPATKSFPDCARDQSASNRPPRSHALNQQNSPHEPDSSRSCLIDVSASETGMPSSMLDEDPNSLLPHNQDMEELISEGIDWTQWDSWLSGTDFQMGTI
ncbi:Aurofusarin cluster transcription factor aurR2 [Exophiala dermatitidis]